MKEKQERGARSKETQRRERVMNELAIETLARRLEQVERDVRWWRRIGITALLVGAVAGLVSATSASHRVFEEIQATRFVVATDDGTERAVFGQRPRSILGEVGLYLFDKSGDADQPRAFMTVSGDGWQKLGFDDPTKNRVSLHASKDATIFSLWPSQGKSEITLHAAPGSQSVMLTDKRDKVRTWLRIDESDFAGLEVHDRNGKARARFDVLPEGVPRLRFDDSDGKFRAVLSLSQSPKESPGDEFAVMTFYRKDEKVIWAAP